MSRGVDGGQVLAGAPRLHDDAANHGGSVVRLVGVAEVKRAGRRVDLRVVIVRSVAEHEPVPAHDQHGCCTDTCNENGISIKINKNTQEVKNNANINQD